jgi:hypothetical protein
MHRYEPRFPAPAFGLAAALVSGAVLTLAVLVPVKLADGARERALAAAKPPVEVAIVPSRIDVIGVRTQRTAENDVGPSGAARAPRS